MRPGLAKGEIRPGVVMHQITCASCGDYMLCASEEFCAKWLFEHSAPNHAPGQPPYGVDR